MTEAEARHVLEVYRYARPRIHEAAVTLSAAGDRHVQIAAAAGLTRAAVTKILQRHPQPKV